MSGWAFYFLAKIALHWQHQLVLVAAPNLLLALLIPLLTGPHARHSQPPGWIWRVLRQLLIAAGAGLLLAGELGWGWGPAFWSGTVPSWMQAAGDLAAFSSEYWIELAQRTLSWVIASEGFGILLVCLGLYLVLDRFARSASWLIVILLGLTLQQGWQQWRQPADDLTLNAATAPVADGRGAERRLRSFYQTEQDKVVQWPQPAPSHSPGFDLLLLSVCSMSWEDLRHIGMSEPAVLKRFDLIFDQFNTGSSYSGPALLRLLRGGCGQPEQHRLYEAQPEACYLFAGLQRLGFSTGWALNHDGRFGRFAEQLRREGGLEVAPDAVGGVPTAMLAFDGSPVRADYELLSGWWRQRTAGTAPPQALLYNTITLHDGNRVPGVASFSSQVTYKPRIERLLHDLDRFLDAVEQSKRPTVVVLIPEHGAALRGSSRQMAGLREIPLPSITHVPVAVALFGGVGGSVHKAPEALAVHVPQPVSYTALTALLATLAGDPALARDLPALAARLPQTDWVAESDRNTVLRLGEQLWIKRSEGGWLPP